MMRPSFLGTLTALLCLLFTYPALGNAEWLDQARQLFSEERIELSLPASGRGLEIPVSVSRNESVHSSNVGDGWKLDVPSLQMDVSLMQRIGTDEPIYSVSGYGQLQKRENYYVPLIQNGSSSVRIYELYDQEQRYFVLHDSAKPRQVLIYGQTAASRLSGEQGTAVWYLSSLVASTGETTSFVYEETEGVYPRLISIQHSDRALAVRLEWSERNETPVPVYTYGRRLMSDRHLGRVVVHNRITQRDLYATVFNYNTDSWTALGRSYLRKASLMDLTDSSLKSPEVWAEYCYAGTCGSERPSVGKGSLDIPSTDISRDLSKGWAKFSKIYRNGQISLAYVQGTAFSTRMMEANRVSPDATEMALIKRGGSAQAGNPSDFGKETIWGMSDFNGDGVDDLWYVPKSQQSLNESRINIRMMKDDGSFLKGESAAGVPFFGASRNSKSYKFARIYTDKSLSFIAGPHNIDFDSFVLSQWNRSQKKFVSRTIKYSDAFDGKFPSEPTHSSKQRFADLNGDGFDDWIEIGESEGRSTVRYFHGKGNARFAEPSVCRLPDAFDSTFTALDFVDVDGDNLFDLLAVDKGIYLLNSGSGCFKGPTDNSESYFSLNFNGQVGSETGVNRVYLDANGDGRQDLLVYGSIGASYHSFLGTAPDPRKIVSLRNSFGLQRDFGYEPVVGFASTKPIGVPSPREQGIVPAITEGFMVVSRIVESDRRLPDQGQRTTLLKYWGPTYHEINQFWGGFQIVEKLMQGDDTQATVISQTMNATGRVRNPYLTGPTLETLYDATGRKYESTAYKYASLGEYQADDPYNTQGRTYRSALRSKETTRYGDSDTARLQTLIKAEYEFDQDYETYRKALYADEVPVRAIRSCDGRTCRQMGYEEDFIWQAGSLGLTFHDPNLVKTEEAYSQAHPERLIGRQEYLYYPESGLPRQLRKCGDRLCSAAGTDTTLYVYDDRDYLFKEVSTRGAETVYHRDETWPWRLTGKETILPKTLHEPKKFFVEEISGYNEAEISEIQIDIQGRKVKSKTSPLGFVFETESFAFGSEATPFHRVSNVYNIEHRELKTIETGLLKQDADQSRISGSKFNAFGNVIRTFAGEGEYRIEQDFFFGPLGLNHTTSLPHYPGEEVAAQKRVFDAAGRKIQVVRTSGLVVKADFNGRFITLTEEDVGTGKTSRKSFEVNSYDEVTNLTNELGAEYFFERDEAGQIAVYRDSKGIERVFERDLQRRLTGIKERVNEGPWHILRSISYGMDANPDEVRVPSGAKTAYRYDPLGRTLVRESHESGGFGRKAAIFHYDRPLTSNANFLTGRFERSHHGQMTQAQMDPGLIKNLLYNDRGLLSETEYLVGQGLEFGEQTFVMRMQYSGFGELNRLFYPDGYQLRKSFDNQGRLRAVEGRPDASSAWSPHVNYDDYRAFGSAETISYGNGIKTKADFLPGLARIRSLKSTTSQGQSVLDLNFVLDAFDNIESIDDHALKLTGLSSRFDFGYDEAHQLKSASGPYGSLAYDYDITGLMLGFEGTQFEHDPLNPLRPINQKNGSGQVIANFAYDADGNRIMKNDSIKGLKSFYEWDAEGRLGAVCEVNSCAEGGRLVARYYYDESGNRIAKMGSDGQLDTIYFGSFFEVRERKKQWVKYVHGAKDQIVSSLHSARGSSLTLARWWKDLIDVTMSALSADPNGSIISSSRVDLKNVVNWRILSLFVVFNGGLLFTLIMLMRRTMAFASRWRRLSISYRFLLPQRFSAALAAFSMALGPFHMAPAAWAANPDESVLYYHSDHAGSTSLVSNKDGLVVQRNILKPFGGLWEHDGLENSLKNSRVAHYFQGLERDSETGLDVMGARMYDPSIGQFISRDPLFESNVELGLESPNELSLYAFARNNPLRYTDPTGLASEGDDEEEISTPDFSDSAADQSAENDTDGTQYDFGAEVGRNWGKEGNWTENFSLGVPDLFAPFQPEEGIGGSDFVSDIIFDTILTFGAGLVARGANALWDMGSAAFRSGILSRPFAPGAGQAGSVSSDLLTLGLGGSRTKFLDSSTVRFTQDSISTNFRDGRSLRLLVDDLKSGRVLPKDLPPIRVFQRDGLLYTLDNRRLAASILARVPVNATKATSYEIMRELPSKFTTHNQGLIIGLRGIY